MPWIIGMDHHVGIIKRDISIFGPRLASSVIPYRPSGMPSGSKRLSLGVGSLVSNNMLLPLLANVARAPGVPFCNFALHSSQHSRTGDRPMVGGLNSVSERASAQSYRREWRITMEP
jgi:hypothetical protein